MSDKDKPNQSQPRVISGSSQNNSNKCVTPPNTPWGSQSAASLSYIHKVTPFEEVMSEQLATNLQVQEEVLSFPNLQNDEAMCAPSNQDDTTLHDIDDAIKNDALIAQNLQAQFDQEYNSSLQTREHYVNKNSKVKISYQNYRTDDMFVEEDSDDEDDDYFLLPSDQGFNQSIDPSDQMLNFNKRGYVKFGNEVITKHDAEISARRNTAKLEDSMPPEFRTGDTRGMDLLLSNRSYNQLKRHAKSDQKRSSKLRENKDISTAEHALDDQSKKILNRMVDRGFISEVYGVISKGKEAVVLHADSGEGVDASQTGAAVSRGNRNDSYVLPINLPKEVAIKVYQTTLGEYKSRDQYIKDDFRFKDRYKKLNDRKIIYMWAEKEMHNLNRMRQHGINCPRVVLLKKHILLMSFIGEDCKSAPQLKVARLSTEHKYSAYNQVLEIMRKLYNDCKLVHADLSEYNLLWHQQKVWVIDVSQSVEPTHPHALEFLRRDCKNIATFFRRLGLHDVMDPMEMFNHVSGLEISMENEQDFMLRCEEIQRENQQNASKRKLCSAKLVEPVTN